MVTGLDVLLFRSSLFKNTASVQPKARRAEVRVPPVVSSVSVVVFDFEPRPTRITRRKFAPLGKATFRICPASPLNFVEAFRWWLSNPAVSASSLAAILVNFLSSYSARIAVSVEGVDFTKLICGRVFSKFIIFGSLGCREGLFLVETISKFSLFHYALKRKCRLLTVIFFARC